MIGITCCLKSPYRSDPQIVVGFAALMRSVPVLLVVIFLYILWLNLVCILVTPNFALAL